MFSALILEICILKEKMRRNSIVLLAKADLTFGISAVFIVVTGLLRMYYFGKGINYYITNPIFVLKFSLFILIGVLSIMPTLQFLKIRKTKTEFEKIKHIKMFKLLIGTELVLLLIIPLLAVLVAKGIGL
jgi:putative membrane protein